MKFSDIIIGQTYHHVKELTRNSEGFILIPFPSFVATNYKIIQNLDTLEEIYVLFEDDRIIDITSEFDKAVDWGKSRRTLDFILYNLT